MAPCLQHSHCKLALIISVIKHSGWLGSRSESLKPSHANQWCFSLSDLSLKGTATTCQLWLVVSPFPPSCCVMLTATLSTPTEGWTGLTCWLWKRSDMTCWPYNVLKFSLMCLRWCWASDITWEHFRVSQGKTQQKVLLRVTTGHLRHQYTATKVVVRWLNSVWNP